MPHRFTFEQAAAVGVAYLTASVALNAAKIRPGETVLILGTRGAVGSAAARITNAVREFWARFAERPSSLTPRNCRLISG